MTDLIPIRRELLERLYEAAGRGTGMENEDLRSVRAALATPVHGEAVAWARQCDLDESDPAISVAREEVKESGYLVPLYTTPPQPAPVQGEAVSLDMTEEEFERLNRQSLGYTNSREVLVRSLIGHFSAQLRGYAASPQPADVGELVELLRMVRQDGWYHPLEEHEIAQIDAALAEVKPCLESPAPTT